MYKKFPKTLLDEALGFQTANKNTSILPVLEYYHSCTKWGLPEVLAESGKVKSLKKMAPDSYNTLSDQYSLSAGPEILTRASQSFF